MCCPTCGNPHAQSLGILGNLEHLRCRDCGQQWSQDASLEDDDEATLEAFTFNEVNDGLTARAY